MNSSGMEHHSLFESLDITPTSTSQSGSGEIYHRLHDDSWGIKHRQRNGRFHHENGTLNEVDHLSFFYCDMATPSSPTDLLVLVNIEKRKRNRINFLLHPMIISTR